MQTGDLSGLGYIQLSAGTTGTDLFSSLTGFTEFETAERSYTYGIPLACNKKIIKANDEFSILAPPKFVKNYGEYAPYANKILFQVAHGASEAVNLELYIRIYREWS